MDNYKEITPSNILNGQWGAVMDYVCTHRPVKIVSKYRPSMMIVHAIDYEEMKAKVPQWISVGDELPKEDKSTMRYIPLNLLVNNRIVVQGGYHYGDFYLDGAIITNVTHFMALPKKDG